MLWKTFFTCGVAVFCLAVFEAATHGHLDHWTASALKFGKVRVEDVTPSDVVPGAIILGVISGLLGPLFINVNTRINAFRAQIWTTKWQKPIDTFLFCFASASCFYWAPYLFRSCKSRTMLEANLEVELELSLEEVGDSEEESNVYQAWCEDPNDFDPLASIFWQTEGGLIRDILSESVMCSTTQMFVFACVWYFWTIVTYGTNVPSGLFLPGMIIGCALGEIYAKICWNIGVFDEEHYLQYRVIYIILGMGAMLAGYTRMTYSLAVIVMETSQAINIFIPIIFTIAVANFTGRFFTRGLYDRACRAKQMPLLKHEHVPEQCRQIRAEQIMAKNVISLSGVVTVKKIYEALKSPHHGFPVLNMSGEVIGLIPKNFLVVLIRERAWYANVGQKYHVIDGAIKQYIKDAFANNKLNQALNNSHNQNQSQLSHRYTNDQDGQSNNSYMENHSRMNLKKNNDDIRSWQQMEADNNELKMAKEKSALKKQVTQVVKGLKQDTDDLQSNNSRLALPVQGVLIDSKSPIPGHSPNNKTQVDSDDSSEITLFGGNQAFKPFDYKKYFDYDAFPESQADVLISWRKFTRDFTSLDLKLDKALETQCQSAPDKLVDLRPYMIENAEHCTRFDFLPKILARFRHLHLRHMVVVNPQNNQLEGMITR